MKLRKLFICSCLVVITLLTYGCDSPLKPKVYSETTSTNTLNSLSGINAMLNGAYSNLAMMDVNNAAQALTIPTSMTDIGYGIKGRGATGVWLLNFQNFVLDGSGSYMYATVWNHRYDAIRNANIILDNLDNTDLSKSNKSSIRAQSRFIRAVAYYKLYQWWGPIPLRTSTDQKLELPKASDQKLKQFIETELLAVIPKLPHFGQEKQYGRAQRAAAMGFLTKFYLNTKQWKKSAKMAKKIIDLGTFKLFPSYFGLFQVKNERNKEFIWARTAKADLARTANNDFMNFAWPPGFKSNPRTGLKFCSGCRSFGSPFVLRDKFWKSFKPKDERKSLIIRKYINNDGKLINLLPPNGHVRPFKYWPSSANAVGPAYGNDIPVIRYADILLSRAEALNEINGSNQESIALIDRVRRRAGLKNIDLANFPTKKALRNHICKERGWEFWWEGHRRNTLIRMGKFIKKAQERGQPAKPYMVRMPIPQFALDANPKLKQNPGY